MSTCEKLQRRRRNGACPFVNISRDSRDLLSRELCLAAGLLTVICSAWPGSVFHCRFGGDSRWDKAADLYEKAAAAYKTNENWREAAGALCQSAEMQEKLKDKLSAANKYIEAALCMARADNAEAIR